MSLCRVAWQTLASRFGRAAPLLRGQVPFRQMSSGNVPGSSGENMIYYVFFVGAASAGFFYAYKTVGSDKARYNERIQTIQEKSTAEWNPKPWPPPSLESDETETNEETKDADEETKGAATQETEAVIADESQVQSEEPGESTEPGKGEESPVEEETSGVPGREQDIAASLEATQGQG